MTMHTVPPIAQMSTHAQYNVSKYDAMHVPHHSTHAQYGPKRLILTRFPYSIIHGGSRDSFSLNKDRDKGY